MVSYCDVGDVEAEIRADNAFDNSTVPTQTEVEQWIKEASDYIRDLADREYDSVSVTDEFVHYYGSDFIGLKQAPIQSVSEVEYNAGSISDTDWQTKTEDEDYTVIKDRGQLKLLKGFSPKEGLKRFRVDYTYGESDVPATVRMLCTKMVARRVIDSLLAADVNKENAGTDVQVGSIQVKKPADYGVENYKQLKMRIQELKEEVSSGSRSIRTNTFI